MQQAEITALFDKQAASYDQQWSKMAPINDALHLLTHTVLSELPPQANILCVGAGTGAEILYLAQKFPEWHFTAVEPSTAMLAVFQRRAEEQGIAARCVCHAGYLDSLPSNGSFDAATTFLVSQFILDRQVRSQFFQSIAERLGPAGLLVSADLAGDLTAPECQDLLGLWFRVMSGNGAAPSPEGIARMHTAYSRDVAVLPPRDVRDIITRGGFDSPVLFFQAGMIHAWYAKRASSQADQFNLASAQAAARDGQLAAWVDRYLRTSVRPNVPFADGLQLERRWWAGPRLLPLDQLTRCSGPEPEMAFRVPADDWERYVTLLAAGLTTPEALPPLIVLYQDGRRIISDGNNRHEAMRRRGWRSCWVLMWYTSQEDYHRDAEL